MCQGGNCRSVGLAFVLKYSYGHDAIACGWERNDFDTIEMLSEWADRIFIVQSEFLAHVPIGFIDKVTVYELGPDVWFNSLHQDLLNKCNELIMKDEKWWDFEDLEVQ